MEDGQGLMVIAFLVIAFINWLSTTLKEKAAQREIERKRARGELEEDTFDWGEEEPQWQQTAEARPAPAQQQPINQKDELRDFFEALAGKTPPRQPEPVATAQAPSTAARTARQASEIKRVKLSDQEKAALRRFEANSTGGMERPAIKVHPLIEKLRQPGGPRDAVVFAEIFGKPKGMADQEDY